jgi:hypothetical protein
MDDSKCPHCGRLYGFMHLPEDCTPEQRALAYAPRRSPWLGWVVVALVLSASCAGGYYVFSAPSTVQP